MTVLDAAVHTWAKTKSLAQGITIPERSWNTQALMMTKFTDDWPKLATKTHWLLFDYDSYHSPEQRCIGFTSDSFRVWKKDMGSEGSGLVALEEQPGDANVANVPPWANPISKCAYTLSPAARVRGIIRRIPSQAYLELDTDAQNGIMFSRKRVSILVPRRTMRQVNKNLERPVFTTQMTVTSIEAWMYVGVPEYFNSDEGIDAGFLYQVAKLESPASLWIKDFYTV